MNDPEYLKNEQYGTSENLNARIRLHQKFGTDRRSNLQQWLLDPLIIDTKIREPRILEVGAGNGEFWRQNATRIPPGWQMTLTDFSPGMLEDAKANLGELAERFTFEEADAMALPYEDDSFDIVIANFMLYHVPDRDKAISEFRRVLAKKGKLYAATNGETHMAELTELINEIGITPLDFNASQSGFSLENGREQLEQHFGRVLLNIYSSDLEVTEAQPLIDYIASLQVATEMTDELQARITARINEQLEADGKILIHRYSGVFIADQVIANQVKEA